MSKERLSRRSGRGLISGENRGHAQAKISLKKGQSVGRQKERTTGGIEDCGTRGAYHKGERMGNHLSADLL